MSLRLKGRIERVPGLSGNEKQWGWNALDRPQNMAKIFCHIARRYVVCGQPFSTCVCRLSEEVQSFPVPEPNPCPGWPWKQMVSSQSLFSPWSGSRASTTATGVFTVVLSKTATAQWLGENRGALSFTSSTWRVTSAWQDWPPPSVALATRLYTSFLSRSRAVSVVSSPGRRNDNRWAFLPEWRDLSTYPLDIYASHTEFCPREKQSVLCTYG